MSKPEDCPEYHQPNECPHCLESMDCATGINHNDRPQAGMLSVCLYCGGLSQFNEQGSLITLSEEEMEQIDEEAKAIIANAREIISQWNAVRKPYHETNNRQNRS